MAAKKSKSVAYTPVTPKFNNGAVVKDNVTGLEGIITCMTIWMNGCVRYVIQPQELKDGKPVEPTVVDEQQLVLVADSEPDTLEVTGGGRDDSKATTRHGKFR
jgi:hypothetical protein